MRNFISIIFSSVFIIFFIASLSAREHPSISINKSEAKLLNSSLGKYPLLDQSYQQLVSEVDKFLIESIIVPQPGEAGGYAHEKHKQNYRDMQKSGNLFTISGEEKYARFVRDMLNKYADLYPTLGPHPLAHHQAPGMLFHQMLNETVWLTYTSQAYDCIYDWLKPEEREHFEKNIFRVIIDWFLDENAHEVDRIHNHGTWSVASLGMIGYVLDDQELVDMALYGTKKDGKGGFLKQMDLLFSPDGYYMEGPYYIRYALRPFFLFAEAIERNQPELKIYEYRDKILKKAIYSALQTTFPDGIFPPINDASLTMNIKAPGVLYATNLAYFHYGADPNLLGIVKIQNVVVMNRAGLEIARDFTDYKEVPDADWGSIEFTDGYDGKQGGLGILRNGVGAAQSMLLMKYGVQGGGHGHYDKLHFIFYGQNRQIINDYGFGRWINIEPKFGGRYLPENKSYAMQTIAHNTVVVDKTTQNKYKRKEAEKVSGKRHFFDANNKNVQVISASANDYYPGVEMQRTMFLINDDRLKYPVIVDLYRLASQENHTYDYPIHYTGQIMSTSFEYQAEPNQQVPLGSDFGYQHVWKEGGAKTNDDIIFTWLDGNRFYSLITAGHKSTELLLGRIGANDPEFNLRSEPMLIRRNTGKNFLFASVIEPHGYFNEAGEKSEETSPRIQSVKIIGHNTDGSIIEVEGKNNLKWRIMVNNGPASEKAQHRVEFEGNAFTWQGNFNADLNAK